MLQGSDLLVVECNFDIGPKVQRSLMDFYEPLVGSGAIKLFNALAIIDQEQAHLKLIDMLGITLHQIEQYRIQLEQVGLLRTYQQQELYCYQLVQPLIGNQFLTHYDYGRWLFKVKGHDYFRQLKHYYRINDLTEFTNITAKFDRRVMQQWSEQAEQLYQELMSTKLKKIVSPSVFFQGVSPLLIPYELRNPILVSTLISLAEMYNLSREVVIEHAYRCVNIKKMTFDERKLINHLNKLKPVSTSVGYDQSCVEFLQSYQSQGPVSSSEVAYLVQLKQKYGFSDQVLNVMIEYVMKQYNMQMNSKIMDKIAASWDRLKITTVQEALNALQPKTSRSKVDKPTPEWIDTKIKPHVQVDEEVDLEELMKDLQRFK